MAGSGLLLCWNLYVDHLLLFYLSARILVLYSHLAISGDARRLNSSRIFWANSDADPINLSDLLPLLVELLLTSLTAKASVGPIFSV